MQADEHEHDTALQIIVVDYFEIAASEVVQHADDPAEPHISQLA